MQLPTGRKVMMRDGSVGRITRQLGGGDVMVKLTSGADRAVADGHYEDCDFEAQEQERKAAAAQEAGEPAPQPTSDVPGSSPFNDPKPVEEAHSVPETAEAAPPAGVETTNVESPQG